MHLSVVTICFNQVKFIERCIQSVLLQNLDIEHIIVDPGSTDGSRDIIDKHAHVRKIYSADRGPSDGLRKGMLLASCDKLCFLNADDEFVPFSLERIITSWKSKTDIIFANGFQVINNHERRPINQNGISYNSYLFRRMIMFQQGIFFTKDIYLNSSGFNPNNKACWDYELVLDMLSLQPIIQIEKDRVAIFHIHSDSISGSGSLNEEYAKDLRRIFRHFSGREWTAIDSIRLLFFRIHRKLTLWLKDSLN